jgi:hypothetical protein
MIGPPGTEGVKSEAMSALNFVPSAGVAIYSTWQCKQTSEPPWTGTPDNQLKHLVHKIFDLDKKM